MILRFSLYLGLALIKLSVDHYLFVGCFHHIITDGQFFKFFTDLSIVYNKFINGENVDIVDISPPLENYLSFEKQNYTELQKQNDIQYWRELVDNQSLDIGLPKTRKSSTEIADSEYFSFDIEASLKITSLIKQERTTLFIFLSAILGILLSRYSGQKNVFLNYPVNIRPPKFHNLYGCFNNDLLMKISLIDRMSFRDVIKASTMQRKESRKHQNIPYNEMIYELRKSDSSHDDNTNVLIAEVPLRANASLDLIDLDVKALPPVEEFAIDDLVLEFEKLYGTVNLRITYDSNQFTKSFINQLVKHFKLLINKCIEDINTEVNGVPLLTEEEYQKIIYDWNSAEAPYPKNKTIHHLFEEQVEKTPDDVAVVFEDKQLTYRELNRRANKFAHYIKSKYKQLYKTELPHDTIIPICTKRSIEMLIGILGILKSGSAYVPIDPKLAIERVKFILNDTDAKIILIQEEIFNQNKLNNYSKKLIFLDNNRDVDLFSSDNITEINRPTGLAYVFYTSGSTGRPKGVLGEHKGILNRFYWMWERYPWG